MEVVKGDVIHMEEGAESAAARSQCTRASRGYCCYCYLVGNGRCRERTRSAQALEMRCEVSDGDNLAEDGGGVVRWWWRRRRW